MRSGITDERDRPPLLALAADERREHRRVEHQPFAGFRPSSSCSDAIGGPRRRRLPAAPRGLAPAAARNTTRTICPLKLGARGMMRDRAGADGELARLLDVRALRVAEIVQPIDELLVGERLAARAARAAARRPAAARVSRSPCSRASISRREA